MENGSGALNANGAAGAVAVATGTPMAPPVREQDRLMPIANVIRIMRRVLPPHAKISDDAKELIQECVSEFISFVTGEANERCHAEHRKTVTAEDVVWAMERLGFDDYVLPLTLFLQRMRECEAGGVTRAPGNGVQVQMQMHRAVYAHPAPAQGYAVAVAPLVQANTGVVSPRVVVGGGPGQQRDVFGTERVVGVAQQCCGDGAYGGEGSSSSRGGGCGDEESSSNGAPVPAATGTALPDPQ
uniref:Uncharacterized protein n=1 Tax=Avena sativa TaxID=4498 RepID=A0ACD5VCH2_AVESA